MTPAEAARKEIPDPDRSLYDMDSDGAERYRNACIATELRREGFVMAKKEDAALLAECSEWMARNDHEHDCEMFFQHTDQDVERCACGRDKLLAKLKQILDP